MHILARRQSLFGRPQEADEDSRPSGVRRIAPVAPVDEQADAAASERPTVPVLAGRVIEDASETARVYTRVATGRLPVAIAPQADGSYDRVTARTTRDLLVALGSLEHVPVRTRASDDLRTARIDNRQAFVLSLVDGQTSIASIVDASPMAMHKVLYCLTELVGHGLIRFKR
jgi:hypothetical protein